MFFSTGEASGELAAVDLAEAMRRRAEIACEGIGGERMRAAGFTIVRDTRGWSSIGPVDALARIPPLLAINLLTAMRLRRSPPDLLVLVDFGAFNLRLAAVLRRIGYRGRILYYFPPSAWMDDAKRARQVARLTVPLTAFAHQRDFYRSLDLEIACFGHPLVSGIAPRGPVALASPRGGHIALLPGSRRGELRRHVPLLLAAFDRLAARRPALEATFGAADDEAEARIRAAIADRTGLTVVRGARPALAVANAAAIASGTAVLEAALLGVPAVMLYVVSRAQERMGRRLLRTRIVGGRFAGLPNLVTQREIVPELLGGGATPERVAAALETLLVDPAPQLEAFAALRRELGDASSLDRCADFALALARG